MLGGRPLAGPQTCPGCCPLRCGRCPLQGIPWASALEPAVDRLVVHFPLALRAASIPAGPLAHGPSHPRPVFLTASASVSCPSPWQPPAGLWLLDLPCPPCGVCRARLLGSLHQPRTERGSRVHAWPSLTIPLGRLNSERPPLIWPRAILSSGLSPSRIPVKKLERYASTLPSAGLSTYKTHPPPL